VKEALEKIFSGRRSEGSHHLEAITSNFQTDKDFGQRKKRKNRCASPPEENDKSRDLVTLQMPEHQALGSEQNPGSFKRSVGERAEPCGGRRTPSGTGERVQLYKAAKSMASGMPNRGDPY